MFQEWYYGVALAGFLVTTLLWITNKFANLEKQLTNVIQKTFDKVFEKLEYHERHDDERFSQVRSDLHNIQLRNASKDVIMDDIVADLRKLYQNGKTPKSQATG